MDALRSFQSKATPRSSLECPNYHFIKHSLDISLGEGHFIRLGYLRKQGEDTEKSLRASLATFHSMSRNSHGALSASA